MLKERARILAVGIFLLDLSLIALAFLAAYGVRNAVLPWAAPGAFPGPLYPLAEYLPLLPLALAIWGGLLLSSGRYRSHRTVPLLDEAWAIIRVCVTGAVIFTLCLYALRLDRELLGDDNISRFWVLLFAVFSCLLLLDREARGAPDLALRAAARLQLPHGAHRRHRTRRR